MNKDVLRKQKEHHTKEDSKESFNTSDLETYIDSVKKEYSKKRRRDWWANYQEYLDNKYPKGGKVNPKISSTKEHE